MIGGTYGCIWMLFLATVELSVFSPVCVVCRSKCFETAVLGWDDGGGHVISRFK